MIRTVCNSYFASVDILLLMKCRTMVYLAIVWCLYLLQDLIQDSELYLVILSLEVPPGWDSFSDFPRVW